MALAADGDRILARVETQPLGPVHIFVLSLCALGFGFDLAELGLGNVLSAVFSAPPVSAAPSKLSWLIAAPYIGGIIGAPAFGWLADRHGRRSTLVVMMVSLGIFSLLGSQAHLIETLTVYRILCGLTLGAFPPVIIAYMTDLLPARGRGRVLMMTCAAAILGIPLSVFFVRWLTPIHPLGIDAWRWAFILYGAGSILTGLALVAAPETVRWLVKAGRQDQALAVLRRLGGKREIFPVEESNYSPAVSGPEAAPVAVKAWQVLAFVAFSFLSAWATVAFPVLSGAILVQKGVKVPDALLYVGIASLGPFVSMLGSSFVIDRFGRRPVLWGAGVVMLLTASAFALGTVPWLFIASGLVFQIANSIFVPTTSMYMAEVFSTRSRGRATSSLWAVNRFGCVIAPLFLLPVLHTRGPMALFIIIAVMFVLCMAILAVMPRGRAGLTVD